MTPQILAVLLLGLLLLGCGRYGPPLRAGTQAGDAALEHAASCQDPEHDHDDAEGPSGEKP